MPDFRIAAKVCDQLEPAGLEYCRQNGLSTEYDPRKWTLVHDSVDLEELLIVGTTVIWTTGRILKRAFGFAEEKQEVRQAVFAHFPPPNSEIFQRSADVSSRPTVDVRSESKAFSSSKPFKSTANLVHELPSLCDANQPERALVIVLDEIAYIYYLDGRRDVINLSFRVKNAFASSVGLVLERYLDIEEFPKSYRDKLDDIPKFFYLPDPAVELGVLIEDPRKKRSLRSQDELCFLEKRLFVTANRDRSTVSIWLMSQSAELCPEPSSTSLRSNHVRRRSSMRTSAVNLTKVDDVEDDRKVSSTSRTDVSTHLDRLMFSDIDPNILYNQAETLRRDFVLTLIETLPVQCHEAKPEVYLLEMSETSIVLCIYSPQQKTLQELVLRHTQASRPTVIQSNKIHCQGAARVRLCGIDYSLIRNIDATFSLRAPFSPDISVDMSRHSENGQLKSLTSFRSTSVACAYTDESQLVIELSCGSEEKAIQRSLTIFSTLMAIQHYRLFFAAYVDMSHHLPGATKMDSFACTILACFLDTTLERRSVDFDHNLTIDNSILVWVSEADSLARRHNMTELRSYLPQLLLGTHFISEEFSLDIMMTHYRQKLLPLLAQMSQWLKWDNYIDYYISLYHTELDIALDEPLDYLQLPVPSDGPPSVCRWVEMLMSGAKEKLQTIELLMPGNQLDNFSHGVTPKHKKSLCPTTYAIGRIFEMLTAETKSLYDVVNLMVDIGFQRNILERLPQAISIPIRDVIDYCSLNPSADWGVDTLKFIERNDLANFLSTSMPRGGLLPQDELGDHIIEKLNVTEILASTGDTSTSVGVDRVTDSENNDLSRLLFKDDRRLQEVSRMLQCHKVTIAQCVNSEQLGEAEQIRQQQDFAKLVVERTLAIPVGRALLNFDFKNPLPTEKFPIAKLNLDVKIKPAMVTVSEDKAHSTAPVKAWSQFHNGVAAGVSLSRSCKEISASWIVYNKPDELTNAHAGFLLGLGLNGHLKAMATWHAFNYLTSKHTMTSIGLLLGLSASFLGTMDPVITKLLSVHILALLPVGSNELNLAGPTQTAGILGIGLLHYDTSHARMSEVMLKEIANHDSSPEHFRDESYRLAAGIALGMINVGRGSQQQGTRDLNFLRLLLDCVQGSDREKHDLDVRMPGAIIALGLMYLRTNNKYVADRLRLPTTQHELHLIRPDLYLLRVLCRALVMWEELTPTMAYLEAQLPPSDKGRADLADIDWHNTDDLILFNTIAGICFAIGMKFAGTHETAPRDLILRYIDRFIEICDMDAVGVDQKANVVAVRTILGVLSFSAAMIMAGSGDLLVMRRLRRLHYRLIIDTSYGHYMATEMSIGLLFLSGGRSSLSRSNLAICSMIIAFYPVLPRNTNDNKSHLQALRHFWILAAEARCVMPKDTNSHKACLVPIEIVYRGEGNDKSEQRMAPCLLPPLETVSSVRTSGPDYWPLTLDFEKIPEHLAAFRKDQTFYVTRKRAPDSVLKTLPLAANLKNAPASLSRALAESARALLKREPQNLVPMIERAITSQDPWDACVLSARTSVLSCLANSHNTTRIREVRLVIAYWKATTRGNLAPKFAKCQRRILDEGFVQQLELDLWRMSNDSNIG